MNNIDCNLILIYYDTEECLVMNKLIKIETVNHITLLKLLQFGLVHEVSVVGGEEGWQIIIKHEKVEQYLSAVHSKQIRIFRRLDTAVFYLKNLGIQEVMVKVADYNPEIKTGKRSRPDRSEALKKTKTQR